MASGRVARLVRHRHGSPNRGSLNSGSSVSDRRQAFRSSRSARVSVNQRIASVLFEAVSTDASVGPVRERPRASCVMVQHVLQGRDADVVHVGSGDRDVAQPWLTVSVRAGVRADTVPAGIRANSAMRKASHSVRRVIIVVRVCPVRTSNLRHWTSAANADRAVILQTSTHVGRCAAILQGPSSDRSSRPSSTTSTGLTRCAA